MNDYGYLTQEDLEDIKQYRWFVMHHLDRCSICGKEFECGNSYFGHLEDGTFAYTCEACKDLIKVLKFSANAHKLPYTIPDPDAKLWRYMDLAKFLSLLETQSLFFTRLDHFKDSFEGVLGVKKNEEPWIKGQLWLKKIMLRAGIEYQNQYISDEKLDVLANRKLEECRERAKNWRTMNYANCWHQSDAESEAMWKLYSNDSKQGIAIQTTFRRLYQAFPSTVFANFGMVKYVNYGDYNNGTSKNTFNILEAPWYKRDSLSYEKEFRIIIDDLRMPGFQDYRKMVKINLNMLVENIYISPEAEDWFYELVKDIVRNRYGLKLNVSKSSISERPFY